ncbi:MAG TPA: DUF1294 domain-containing protein [Anaerolineaceae bacterium]|nr:DUF1294 domain-containing protein [Anaerolineaceae bacterium]
MQPFLDIIIRSPILLYYSVLNLLVAVLYLIDKLKAIGRRWRIPEKTLLLPAVFGGAFGGLVGMLVFRHKTRKSIFWAINGVFAAVHLVILFLLTKNSLIPSLPL